MRILMPMLVAVSLMLMLGCSEDPGTVGAGDGNVDTLSTTDQPNDATNETSGAAAAGGETGEPAVERVEAKAGVGKQGQALATVEDNNINRAIAQPVRSLFAVKQKAVFDFQIKPALNLYKGSNGKMPQSHDEFMEKIIQQNNISLPELPDGEKYEWDPKEEKLYVIKPAG